MTLGIIHKQARFNMSTFSFFSLNVNIKNNLKIQTIYDSNYMNVHTKCNRFKGLRLGRFFRISELPLDHHLFDQKYSKTVKYYYIKKCVLCILIMYVSKYTHAWCMICIMRVCIYSNPNPIYIYIYTVMAKNIDTLGKYDQRRLWKWICIVNPFYLLFKKIHKNLTFHWMIIIQNGGKYHYEMFFFSQIHVGHNYWHP